MQASQGFGVPILFEKTLETGERRKFKGCFFPDVPSDRHFPCFAVFIDPAHALIVRPRQQNGKQPQVLTSELVRDRAENELPNWRWRHDGQMVRVGIAEFAAPEDEDPGQSSGLLAGEVMKAEERGPRQRGRQDWAPTDGDDARICVLIK